MGNIKQFEARDWVKVRNSVEGKRVFLTWSGAVYALLPNEPKIHLFNIAGMNVSRCFLNPDGGWQFTSRELTYYLAPDAEDILHQWKNPWTDEVLPVMHVANNPVQGKPFKGQYPAKVEGDFTTFSFDLFSNYPNPLAGEDRFLPYSPNPIYQSTELFKLTVPTQDLLDPDVTSVSSVILGWDRIGPWVPWMKMGTQPGQLIYSASGVKVTTVESLPQLLQAQINTRLPAYRNAPTQYIDGENMTSWRYFKQHFEDYLAKKEFPIPDQMMTSPHISSKVQS